MPRILRAACRLEADREGASWERRCIPACLVNRLASLAVPAIARGPPVAAILRVPRWRLVHDRIRLWTRGVRALVMELCCALHPFRYRPTLWQASVAAG